MKNIMLTFLLYSAGSLFCSAQDLQWLVLNYNGKENNTYANVNALTSNEFTLEAIKHPNCQCNSIARNDIFVIYDDGSHFNSRLNLSPTASGFFYPPNPADLSHTKHNMRAPAGRIPRYLYLTNIYEDDDLPLPVKAKNGFSGSNANPYEMITTHTAKKITASHDVTQKSDITLAIRSDAVVNGDKLIFKVKGLSGAAPPTIGDFFTGAPIFNGQMLSHGTASWLPGNNGFKFQGLPANPPEFYYINLKPTASLGPYFPTNFGSPVPVYEAIFELTEDNINGIKATAKENIVGSHDPNFVQLNRICRNSRNRFYAVYHIEFKNTSFIPAKDLKIVVNLPAFLDPLTISAINWNAGGNNQAGTIHVINQEATFVFPKENAVQACDSLNDPQGEMATGFVEFCVRVRNAEKEKIHPHGALKPGHAVVYFGDEPYLVDKFGQPWDEGGLPINFQVDCNCADTFRPVRRFDVLLMKKVWVPKQQALADPRRYLRGRP